MYFNIDNVLVIKKEKLKFFFDFKELLIFSKKNKNKSDAEIIKAYKESLKNQNKNISQFKNVNSNVTIELHVTNACNLKCKYCFIDERCSQKQNINKTMSKDSVKKAFIFAIENFPNTKFFQINLFGGEPLLYANEFQSLIETAKQVFDKRQFKITFSTNGTIFSEEILNFIEDNKINFQISWDGEKTEHDKLRIFSNGKGTSAIIENNFCKFNKLIDYITIRVTLTPNNLDVLKQFKFFQQKGIKKINFGLCSTNLMELLITKKDLPKLFNKFDKLIHYYLNQIILGNEIISIYPFKLYLRKLHWGYKKYSFCSSGKNLFTIDPDDNIFSCHRFVGNNQFQIGDLDNGFYKDRPITRQLKNFNIEDQSACANCFAKYLCGGGCYHEKYTQFSEISCAFIKHIIILCIWFYVKLQNYPEHFDRFVKTLEKY